MKKTLSLIALSAVFAAACAQPPPPAPVPARVAVVEVAPAAEGGAKAFYAAKCAGCHGADGSKGLKGKSADDVATALKGYQAKTYGGAKKEIMEARAAQLSAADITALSAYVAGL